MSQVLTTICHFLQRLYPIRPSVTWNAPIIDFIQVESRSPRLGFTIFLFGVEIVIEVETEVETEAETNAEIETKFEVQSNVETHLR